MFIRPGRPRRSSRFRSGRLRTERERREHLISLGTTIAVKAALGIALIAAAVQSFRAFQTHAPGVSIGLRLFMPILFVLGAAFALRSAARTLHDAREIRATPLDADDSDD